MVIQNVSFFHVLYIFIKLQLWMKRQILIKHYLSPSVTAISFYQI